MLDVGILPSYIAIAIIIVSIILVTLIMLAYNCIKYYYYVTGFEKTQLPRTITKLIFRNTEFNYLKYYNLGREADACMKFATIL